jgi:hypothetical protein
MLNYPAAAPRNVSCDLLSDLQFDIASLQYETKDQRPDHDCHWASALAYITQMSYDECSNGVII